MAMQQIFKTALTLASTVRQEDLGAIRWEMSDTLGLRVYKYVQYSDGANALDAAIGDLGFYLDYANNIVTVDEGDGHRRNPKEGIQASVHGQQPQLRLPSQPS